MHKVLTLVLIVAFAAGARSANSPTWMQVPKDIEIFRLPWISKSLSQAMCAEHYPELAAKNSSAVSTTQAEIKKAEAMVRKDVAGRGADGQRYLAAYLKETQAELDQMLKAAANIPPPSETECQSLVRLVSRADNLFGIWVLFARHMQEQESNVSRTPKSVN